MLKAGNDQRVTGDLLDRGAVLEALTEAEFRPGHEEKMENAPSLLTEQCHPGRG